MTHDNLDLLPAPGRYPFQITDRLTVVVMLPVEVILGWFFDGELLRTAERGIGEA